jgi:hypothetical protein
VRGRLRHAGAGRLPSFERDMIRERMNVGLKRASAQRRRLGRPRLDPKTEPAIRAALAKGDRGMLKIAAGHSQGSQREEIVSRNMQLILGAIILVVIVVGLYKYLSAPAPGPSTVPIPPSAGLPAPKP